MVRSVGTTLRAARRSPRGVLALGILGLVLSGTLGYWLANTGGSVSATVSVAPGLPSTGGIATVTRFSSATVTRSTGRARLTAGVALARITTSYVDVNSLRVMVVWTNLATPTVVLNGQNDQMSMGLYKAVHSGDCSSTSGTTQVVDRRLNLTTPTNSTTYCVHVLTTSLDGTVSGKKLTTGKFLLAENRPTAVFVTKSLPTSTSLGVCASDTAHTGTVATHNYTATTAWCRSSTTTYTRTLFLVASITNGSNNAKGQQSALSSLRFYVHVF